MPDTMITLAGEIIKSLVSWLIVSFRGKWTHLHDESHEHTHSTEVLEHQTTLISRSAAI